MRLFHEQSFSGAWGKPAEVHDGQPQRWRQIQGLEQAGGDLLPTLPCTSVIGEEFLDYKRGEAVQGRPEHSCHGPLVTSFRGSHATIFPGMQSSAGGWSGLEAGVPTQRPEPRCWHQTYLHCHLIPGTSTPAAPRPRGPGTLVHLDRLH